MRRVHHRLHRRARRPAGASDRAIPAGRAARGQRHVALHRRQRRRRRERRDDSVGRSDQRGPRDALHDLDQQQRRHLDDHRHLQPRPQSRRGAGGRAERRPQRYRAPPSGRAADGRHRQENLLREPSSRRDADRRAHVPGRAERLRRASGDRHPQAGEGRRGHPVLRDAALRDAPMARPSPAHGARPDGQRCHHRVAEPEPAGCLRSGRGASDDGQPAVPSRVERPRTALDSRAVREHHRQGDGRRRVRARLRRRTRATRRRRLLDRRALERARQRRLRRRSAVGRERARPFHSGPRRAREDVEDVPARSLLRDSL